MLSLPPFAFAAFVSWLLLFPMGAIPIAGVEIAHPLVAFLLPHAIGLLLIGRFCPASHFAAFSFIATALTLVLTILYPLFPANAPILLPLAGATSAFLSIRTCAMLRQCEKPHINAGIGLVLGNLILLLGMLVPVSATVKLICLSLLLLLPLLSICSHSLTASKNTGLFRYLPFIFIYHLVSGVMYGGIMPAFNQVGIGQGGELVFYILTVICGIILFRINKEYLLALGILLAMLSFSCFLGQSPWAVTLSMYAFQAAAGCVDIFILGYLLSFDNLLEAFGIGNGAVCLSIFFGHQLAIFIGEPSITIAMAGCLILTCSIFALYFGGMRDQSKSAASRRLVTNAELQAIQTLVESPSHNMAVASATLSSREQEVFCSILSGKTYKIAAADLCLSESTVKTYMKRVCDKYDVSNKRELLKKVYAELS